MLLSANPFAPNIWIMSGINFSVAIRARTVIIVMIRRAWAASFPWFTRAIVKCSCCKADERSQKYNDQIKVLHVNISYLSLVCPIERCYLINKFYRYWFEEMNKMIFAIVIVLWCLNKQLNSSKRKADTQKNCVFCHRHRIVRTC